MTKAKGGKPVPMWPFRMWAIMDCKTGKWQGTEYTRAEAALHCRRPFERVARVLVTEVRDGK
jgi:hypothetical protein